jgi:sugar-specific transcriptional regulator TrmB
MDDLKEFLISLGFGKNETEVYWALVKIGESSVLGLSKATRIHRPNIYESLRSLSKKGLVKELTVNKKRLFKAMPITELFDYFNEKKLKLNEIAEKLNLDVNNSEKTTVKPSNLRIILDKIIKQKKETMIYGVSEKFNRILRDSMNIEKINRDYSRFMRVIFSSLDKTIDPFSKKLYSENRWLPSKFELPFTVIISEDKVYLIYYENEIFIIEINNLNIVNRHKSYFEILWRNAIELK